MVNEQDSYWMECTLDEKVDQKVCEYLREHHAEYRNTKQKIKELMEQHPNVEAVFETKDAVTLTAEEHEILHTYFQLESGAELIEREYHFYMGQSMMFSYGSMIAKLKKEIMNPEEGETGRLLDFFMETRTDELEKELRTQNQQYREALDEIKKYEEEIQKLNLPKAVRVQIDRYVSAINWRWVLCWDFLYKSGIKYYTNYIKGRQDWDFVGMFSDEGITGTSIKKRDGFNDMVKTALEGKIDLIITKSVSRFARNTVDSLSTIRKLKDHGVEVYFEKENIWTFDSKGELLITIMSSLAQEESRSISENTLWGIRRSFQNGNEYVPFKHFLGYDRGENGGLVVNEEEAKIVRFIYNRFLNGGTYNGIAAELTQMGVKTPYGNEKWIGPTVRNILTNEKYKGDALLQKKYTSDYLTKKMLVNHGEVPQYYVSECHEAIIEPQIFDLVQAEVLRRNGMSGRHSNTHIFSTKIQCADCGAWFGPVVYHSNTPKRRIVWRCSDKYSKAHEKCHTPALDIEVIKDAFVRSLNEKLEHRDEVLENLKEIRNLISGGERTLQQQTALWEESRLLEEQIQALIMQNARIAMDQEQYQKEFDELVERHSRVKQEYEEQAIAAEQDVGRVAQIDYFISTLEELNAPVTEFDEQLWISMVDHVVVHSKEDIRVVYRDGIEK